MGVISWLLPRIQAKSVHRAVTLLNCTHWETRYCIVGNY